MSLRPPPGVGNRDPGRGPSRAGDANQRQKAGGVPGVAAQRGGDVVVPVGAQDADGEVAQADHGAGVPVRAWEASSAEVVSRRWCSASMPQCPRIQSARRAGWAWAAVRLVTAYTVTVRPADRQPAGSGG